MNSSHIRNHHSGFTLVELLSVIAIVGMLSGILIAIVGPVRRAARASECQSNLRQLGLAMLQYTIDNHGLLPVQQNVNPNPVGVENPSALISWWMLMQKRLELRFPEAGKANLFLCPEAMDTYSKPARRTYGLNLAGAGGQDAVRLSAISLPAQTLLLAETKENGVDGDGYDVIGFGSITGDRFDWRHKADTMNAFFADGSLRALNKSTMTDASPSTLYRMLENLRK
ncbi:MAG: type II secretion system protein [Opitutaceae bacterium]|jgi:prepilin-type N-terminal cleavage/methylation domain-containing protein